MSLCALYFMEGEARRQSYRWLLAEGIVVGGGVEVDYFGFTESSGPLEYFGNGSVDGDDILP